MTFRDLVMKKKQESRESFVSMMQERKALVDGGMPIGEADAAMLAKYGNE